MSPPEMLPQVRDREEAATLEGKTRALLSRLRAGQLSPERVRLAAIYGDKAAAVIAPLSPASERGLALVTATVKLLTPKEFRQAVSDCHSRASGRWQDAWTVQTALRQVSSLLERDQGDPTNAIEHLNNVLAVLLPIKVGDLDLVRYCLLAIGDGIQLGDSALSPQQRALVHALYLEREAYDRQVPLVINYHMSRLLLGCRGFRTA